MTVPPAGHPSRLAARKGGNYASTLRILWILTARIRKAGFPVGNNFLDLLLHVCRQKLQPGLLPYLWPRLCAKGFSLWSTNLLTQIATFPQSRPDVDTSDDIDLDAMWYVLDQPENRDHVIYQPRTWYNGYDLGDRGKSEIQEGDMQVHLLGVDSERRKEAAVHRWLSKIDKSPHKMRIPLEASGYPEKVQMFWEALETAKELLRQSHERSYKLKLKFNEVKDAEKELQSFIHYAAFDTEGLITAMVTLQRASDDAEIQIAEDHQASMVAAIALSDAHLTS